MRKKSKLPFGRHGQKYLESGNLQIIILLFFQTCPNDLFIVIYYIYILYIYIYIYGWVGGALTLEIHEKSHFRAFFWWLLAPNPPQYTLESGSLDWNCSPRVAKWYAKGFNHLTHQVSEWGDEGWASPRPKWAILADFKGQRPPLPPPNIFNIIYIHIYI